MKETVHTLTEEGRPQRRTVDSEDTSLRQAVRELLAGRRMILASNRGPGLPRAQLTRGAGGVVISLIPVLKASGATWVAAASGPEERRLAQDKTRLDLPEDERSYRLRLVPTDEEAYDQYYNQISNRLLWYANHYLWDLPHTPTLLPHIHLAWEEGYRRINQSFAEVIVEEAAGDVPPIVMLQDYHLLLVAGYLRKLLPKAVITHFLHTPWPQPDYLRVLPGKIRKEIFESLLSCNVLGFHTPGYVRNFLWCCQELAGVSVKEGDSALQSDGSVTYVRSYPISIEHGPLKRFAESEEVRRLEEGLIEKNRGLKIILRVDRLELSKNAMRGFLAYDLMLERHPELKGQVKFLAYLYPSRTAVEDYLRYAREIEEQVSLINDRHRLPGWQPIEMEIADNYPRSVAALLVYDVLLVNPTFDGMNLVAKEGPVVNRRNGLLILSENAGAYQELGSQALSVNPFDVDQTADRLYQALTMPDEDRRLRSSALRDMVERTSSVKWLHQQLKDIAELFPAGRN